jgi:hypothetical protein
MLFFVEQFDVSDTVEECNLNDFLFLFIFSFGCPPITTPLFFNIFFELILFY